MATYSVYDNILIKLENVFSQVEMEVDREMADLSKDHRQLELQLSDLKGKVEVLNSLKRTCELYCDNIQELNTLHREVFNTLSNKHLRLRFLQEKELVLNSCLLPLPEIKLPTVIELNKELKIRKRLQEIELLSSFLMDHANFSAYRVELEKAQEIFDLALESGATDSLEEMINIFENYFEKVLNMYDLTTEFLKEFKDFRTQILLQASSIPSFVPNDVLSSQSMLATYQKTKQERQDLEQEVAKLLYQFIMFRNGKKIIQIEIKNISNELESVIFKEYAIKQKIQELRQYKSELNNEKDCFMKDPTVDGYAHAVKQLEMVQHRFKRLMQHKKFDRDVLINRFYSANRAKSEKRYQVAEQTPYNKILFLTLHSPEVSSQDKIAILRLSKPSKLLHSNSGKFFYQRTTKTSLQNIEKTFKKYQMQELH